MTIIAWDGKTLAADKQATSVGRGITVTKIHRVGDRLVGLAGPGDVCRALLDWARKGFDQSTFPEVAKASDADMLVIEPSGQATCYGQGPFPLVIEDKFTALGCGRDYALAAMFLGHDARKAVEVACAIDVNCGCGIDALSLP